MDLGHVSGVCCQAKTFGKRGRNVNTISWLQMHVRISKAFSKWINLLLCPFLSNNLKNPPAFRIRNIYIYIMLCYHSFFVFRTLDIMTKLERCPSLQGYKRKTKCYHCLQNLVGTSNSHVHTRGYRLVPISKSYVSQKDAQRSWQEAFREEE